MQVRRPPLVRIISPFNMMLLSANIKALLKDSFYHNSLFIILSSMTASGIGLIFWVVAARLYSISNVGIASTTFSAACLIATFAGLGMDQSLIRFFPTHSRSMVFGTTLKITTLLSLLFGALFLMGSTFWMPELVVSGNYEIMFVSLVCLINIAYMVHTAFVGKRVAKYGWIQNLILGIRVLLLIPLVSMASQGVMIALLISYIITLVISSWLLYRSEIGLGRLDLGYFKESLWFSTGNYVANLLSNLPAMTLSIIAFNLIGANEAAIYYMAYSIAAIIFLIPSAFTTSLFVEGAHGERLGSTVKKAVTLTFLALVPLILIFYFLGGEMLGILGQDYVSHGLDIFRLMIISSVFLAVCLLESTVLKIIGDLRGLIAMGVMNSLSFFALSYLFVHLSGAGGIGFAWIASYVLTATLGILLVRRARRKINIY